MVTLPIVVPQAIGIFLCNRDNSYNIYEYYIYPITDGDLGWRSSSSASSNYDDALEN